MSMTREEAIKHLHDDWYIENGRLCVDGDKKDAFLEAVGMGIKALRPVSREQVEKVWKSEWIDNGERDPNDVPKTFAISCKRCGSSAGTTWMRFCPACGAPMTDEAVDIELRRWKEAVDGETGRR